MHAKYCFIKTLIFVTLVQVYDGIKHLEIAAHYRSCFRMTARNGSVIVDYSFAFNTSYALSAVQLNKAFNFQAANASEGKVRLVTGDANYIISGELTT